MKRRQTAADLEALLEEQFDWLCASAEAFDRGSSSEAKRIATIVRTLLYDTSRSKSLLGQLDLKDTVPFVRRNSVFKRWNAFMCHGLVGLSIDPYDGPSFDPHYDRHERSDTSFQEWWNEIVLSTRGHSRTFSRRDLIWFLANKDGGAHVDALLDESYASIARDHDFGFTAGVPGKTFEWKQNPFLPSVRQIAHELLETLQRLPLLSKKTRPTGAAALVRLRGGLFDRQWSVDQIHAYHAAGHHVMACGVGWWLGEVSIEPRAEGGQQSSRAHANSSPHVAPEACPLESAMVDIAGFVAEARINRGAQPHLSSHTSFNRAAERLGFPRFDVADDVRDRYFHQLQADVDRLLQARWSVVEDLAMALTLSGTLSPAQAAVIVGLGVKHLGELDAFTLKPSSNNSGYVVLVHPEGHAQAGKVAGLQVLVDYTDMRADDSPAVRACASRPNPNSWTIADP